MIYIKLIIASLASAVLSAALYRAYKSPRFSKMSHLKKQAIAGFLFGLLSIAGTEFGIDVGGATLNVRDVAPLCAGLIFGGPAGIISGLIGGIERYFAAAWGAGMFTREACTIATIFAGFFAAFLRKYMFSDRRPGWIFGPFLAVVTEVLHMLLVFAIHIDNAVDAFVVVRVVTMPMIILTSVGVGLSLAVVNWLSKEKKPSERSEINITESFQRYLLACVTLCFVVTSIFTFIFQSRISESETVNMLSRGLNDVKASIAEASDQNIIKVAKNLATAIPHKQVLSTESLYYVATTSGVSEINMVDENGIITVSTNPDFIGYDMASGQQSAEFLVLNEGKSELVQSYGPVSYDPSLYRKYAGIALDKGFIQVGYDAELFQKDLAELISVASHNRRIGEDGYIIICDKNMNLVSSSKHIESTVVDNLKAMIGSTPENEIFEVSEDKDDYKVSFCMYDTVEGFYIFALRSEEESLFSRDMTVYLTIFMEVMVFAALFVTIYILIRITVVENVLKINNDLNQIAAGNLDIHVDVRENAEFSSLSDDINATVTTLKKLIAEAAARIDKELEYAKNIQYGTLPHVFPPFPERKEFEIYATMNTAKEVGGDFYDFYFISISKLAFMIADVSGKGIPAALFMMRSKTMVKNLASTGMELTEVFSMANDNLCENNEAELFVTAWLGEIDLGTGLVQYVNAGHNDPLIRKKGSSFEYVKGKRGLVLAGMEGIRYKLNEYQLEPGDIIYLYTDGVTEATAAGDVLYGDDRLRDCLNSISDPENTSCDEICRLVKEDVDKFVGDAPQFDDITMLCFKYNGPQS